MTLPNLMNIKGIGKKRYQSITEKMNKESIQLSDLYVMPSDKIKVTFSIPINVAQAIAETGSKLDIKSQSSKRDMPSVDRAIAETGSKLDAKSQGSKEDMPSVDRTLDETDVQVLHKTDNNYPKKLSTLLGNDAPSVLYVWGNLELFNKPSVGFCGSRNVTDKGLNITADITKQISDLGWVTISGHARGVDSKAHQVALENNAGTIIVLPQGLKGFKLRTELRRYANKDNLLIISEFPFDAGWAVGRAMQRNNTIIGLSDAMVLVESRDKGGTFNAGKTALKYKHPLFVIDFKEMASSNAGNQYFIKKGAIRIGKNPVTHQANIKTLQDKIEINSENKNTSEPVVQLSMFGE